MTPDAARRKANHAIRSGVLVRPVECGRCGTTPAPTSDGRAAIQAHHHDYNKPLEVEWLCAKCHRAETPLPEVMGAPAYGVSNGAAKLNEVAVLDILTSRLSSRKMAAKYGVDKETILRVRRGETWKSMC